MPLDCMQLKSLATSSTSLRWSFWPSFSVGPSYRRGSLRGRRESSVSEAIALERVPHQGMPPLDLSGPALSFFEFWPQQIFYAPMILYWLWLTLKHGGRFAL